MVGGSHSRPGRKAGAVYFLLVRYRDRISADVDIGIPVSIDNSSLQIVPDYRVRAGFSVQF